MAIEKGGAIGVLSYLIPDFNQPEQFPNSIPFRSIPFNNETTSWCINLSFQAKKAILSRLEQGRLKLKVQIETQFHPGDELAIIAEVRGSKLPEERFVFSAHVQEPGANDNATGVGAQAEMARVLAQLHQNGKIAPDRTITLLWGDEIRATRRYIEQDKRRATGIKWGMSLDMVGENTSITGGSFLIEKMPDPSAIWTRGEDKHSEWGASPVSEKDFNPHYFNDLVTYICKRQGEKRNWMVNTNPYEGGSDHQPFLDANIPGLLLWHFTDVFYHTDADRIDKVSPTTLQNVGISALATALFLSNGEEKRAESLLKITQVAAEERLLAEIALSKKAVKAGTAAKKEERILEAWKNWYSKAFETIDDLLLTPISSTLKKKITENQKQLRELINEKWETSGRD